MSDTHADLTGPDLVTDGIAKTELVKGAMLLGHAHDEAVLLVRREDKPASTCVPARQCARPH